MTIDKALLALHNHYKILMDMAENVIFKWNSPTVVGFGHLRVGLRTKALNCASNLMTQHMGLSAWKEGKLLSDEELGNISRICKKATQTYFKLGPEQAQFEKIDRYFENVRLGQTPTNITSKSEKLILLAVDTGKSGYTKAGYSSVVALQTGLSDEELVNEMVKRVPENIRDKVVALEVTITRKRRFEKVERYELTE